MLRAVVNEPTVRRVLALLPLQWRAPYECRDRPILTELPDWLITHQSSAGMTKLQDRFESQDGLPVVLFVAVSVERILSHWLTFTTDGAKQGPGSTPTRVATFDIGK